ncbi:MAG TPA: DUF362 domain-containing protein [Bacteroidales bacterium]|nr:DUF362 domain-containing protein [Bacteroidales bacterium]
MSITRRQFVQSSLMTGAGMMLGPLSGFRNPSSLVLFGVNPFIVQNPAAVFVMRTNVDVKTNSEAIRKVGLDFGRSVFGLTDDTDQGIPLTHKVVIKPNLTCRFSDDSRYTIKGTMGIVTDAFFVEGVVESLKELGMSGGQFYIREVNCPDEFADGGYVSMAERTGIDLKGISKPASELPSESVQWVDVPDGMWFKKIPYLWPVNAPDTFLLNISKFKTHSMGMTLCAKNLQGTIAMNYQAHCTAYGTTMKGVNYDHISSSANEDILTNYKKHIHEYVPRWDRPGSNGGLWQETWATRCIDNNSVTVAGLHIIEGIYGRDGNFINGPNEGGLASDYMTNYIIFGRNQFYVDIIGHYLGGHEPGNFGLFHLAKERGMISTINPADIPVYEWNPVTGAVRSNLADFQQYPLKTLYLQRDYNGQTEPYWHLVNETCYYSGTGINDITDNSSGFYIQQNFPNPVRQQTSISFHLPGDGHTLVEILNNNGQVIDIICNKQLICGDHLLNWNSSNKPDGLYICRIIFAGSVKTTKIMVTH